MLGKLFIAVNKALQDISLGLRRFSFSTALLKWFCIFLSEFLSKL